MISLEDVLDITKLSPSFAPKKVSPVWRRLPSNWLDRLSRILLQRRIRPLRIFFRADDVGVSGTAFEALCRLFSFFRVPLALATVPSWLSERRLEKLFKVISYEDEIWGWHQHGWRHVNWEKDGSKSEFGMSRTETQKWLDIWKGYNKMQEIFGNHFLPVFTPPWHSLSQDTFAILKQVGFEAVSMDVKIPKRSKKYGGLKNFRIYLDLHTRKTENSDYAFDELMADLKNLALSKEPAGIMINHKRINLNGFLFLANFIDLAMKNEKIIILSFRDLLANAKA